MATHTQQTRSTQPLEQQDPDKSLRALKDLAGQVVELARKRGAPAAEAFVQRSRQASATVRNGEIERLSEASSKGLGLRIIHNGRLGFASTTDFSRPALEELIDRAIALAKAAAPDDANVLPSASQLSLDKRPKVERLYDPKVADLDPGWKLKAAYQLEQAARDEDPRCDNFEGSGAGESLSEYALASSEGLLDAERGTFVYLWCAPVAKDGDSLQTAYWSDYRRHLAKLDSAEAVGREAARRTVRMLGARKIATCRVPVVFDPQMAASFIGSLASAFNGDLVLKGASFLGDKLGQQIASPLLTLVDDATLPGALASGAFDGEGVPTRRFPLIEDGKLLAFMYDSRSAHKAGTVSTGHAQRGYSSLPSIGPSNLLVKEGASSLEELIAPIKKGLFVTSMLGRGANTITGDYSRGANGLWIENGKLSYPVQEVTVAGGLIDMLQSIDAVGSDLTMRGSIAAPSIRFSELAVAGE